MLPTESSAINNPQALLKEPDTVMTNQDVFQSISFDAIPEAIKSQGHHPMPTLGIVSLGYSQPSMNQAN